MGLEQLGNIGYEVGAVGILIVTGVYLVAIRWWTDHLGRVIAALLGSISIVLITTILRIAHIDIPNFMVIRASMFWLFAVAVWTGLLTLIWAQFFAPTIRRKHEQEADLADSRPGRHGRTDDDPAGQR